jgi:UDP-N-acetylmuramyl pentapeptide synthase
VADIERELAPTIGDVVLLKASRGIELDRTVAALAAPGAAVRR